MSLHIRQALIKKGKDPAKTSRKVALKEIYVPEYERPGRTKQAFKDDTNINKILQKAQITGSISHLQKHGAVYGDFTGAPKDLIEARELIARGEAIFGELPAEIRRDFKNDPLEYFKFVNDPANKKDLRRVLPQIAEPGSYFPDMSPSTPPGALLGGGANTAAEGAGGANEAAETPTEAPSGN